MKNIILFATTLLLWGQCRPKEIPQAANSLDKELRITLNQTIPLTGSNHTDLGKITLVNLNDSRCPANAMCVRQGAAITTFSLEAGTGNQQDGQLFIGDFMPNDARNKRNLTADTMLVQLKDKESYQLILKDVRPYPGTSSEPAEVTFLLKKP